MFKMRSNVGPTIFHNYTQKALSLWRECTNWNTERRCIYNDTHIPWEDPIKVNDKYCFKPMLKESQ